MLLRQQIIDTVRQIFERHGYEPIETPVLEYLDILTGKAGENEKLMYAFTDHGGREVGMRYDLTVPLARVVAMHQNELVLPFKRYHIGPVWRAERSQRGRFREFWQCDADIVGAPSMAADAEGISVLVESLSALNLPNFLVRINHRKLLEALAVVAGVEPERAGSIYRAIDKMDKIGPDGVHEQLVQSGVEEQAADKVLTLVTATGQPDVLLSALRTSLAGIEAADTALHDLDQLFGYLPSFGVPEGKYVLDLALARGLDYYTGPVVEVTVAEPAVGSVSGGGRYDELVGAFSGRPVPATGVSLGLERIIEVGQESGLRDVPPTVADVFVVAFQGDVQSAAKIAASLRQAGLNVDLSLLGDRSVGEQLRYAGRKGIPAAVIAGPDELSEGRASLKDLGTGEQRDYPLSELATQIKHRD
jgi:histidyl-tRNA synthetase